MSDPRKRMSFKGYEFRFNNRQERIPLPRHTYPPCDREGIAIRGINCLIGHPTHDPHPTSVPL